MKQKIIKNSKNNMKVNQSYKCTHISSNGAPTKVIGEDNIFQRSLVFSNILYINNKIAVIQ